MADLATELWSQRCRRLEQSYDMLHDAIEVYIEAVEHMRQKAGLFIRPEEDPLNVLRLALELTFMHPDMQRVDELSRFLGMPPCASSSKTPTGSAADASTGTASATPTAPGAT